MTLPAERLHGDGPAVQSARTSQLLWADLDSHLDPSLPTPRRAFLPTTAVEHWAAVQAGVVAVSTEDIQVHAAYSLKTNPHPDLLRLSRSSGMLVEAISQLELRKALDFGFLPDEVILNGPGKWWPERVACGALRAVFCDSLVEFDEVSRWLRGGDRPAAVLGLRLRPPGLRSRFGVDLGPRSVLEEVASAVRRLPSDVDFGLHFHLPSAVSSVARRWSVFDAMLRMAARLEQASRRSVRTLDIGGGWGPEPLVSRLLPGLAPFLGRAAASLPGLREVLLEPGRGLAQPTAAVLTRVLEVRSTAGGDADVIVDAAVSDVPEIAHHRHRMFSWTASTRQWRAVGRGCGEVLGRSCMESDVLATGVAFAGDPAVGDFVAIADAGAYDTSKSYVFGCG